MINHPTTKIHKKTCTTVKNVPRNERWNFSSTALMITQKLIRTNKMTGNVMISFPAHILVIYYNTQQLKQSGGAVYRIKTFLTFKNRYTPPSTYPDSMDFLTQYTAFLHTPAQSSDFVETHETTLLQKVLELQSTFFPPIHPSELFQYDNQYELLSLVVLPILCGYLGTHVLFKNLVPLTRLCFKMTIALFCALWIRFYFTHELNVLFKWFLKL